MKNGGWFAAYGLCIRSELALPQFAAAAPGEPDAVVRLGAVPEALPEPSCSRRYWQAAPGDFLLRFGDAFRCRVTGGREITVQCLGGGREPFHFASSVWTALLMQRGLLPLHASAVWTEQAGAVLFMGNSGAGKSTLAAGLMARGFNMLTDDVAAVSAAAGSPPCVAPGYPNLRLQADALDQVACLPNGTDGLVPHGADKHLLPAKRFARKPQTLRAAYVLKNKTAESLELSKPKPVKAWRTWARLVHRPGYAYPLGCAEAHFRILANICREVPMTQIFRPAGGIEPAALAERIECHLAGGSV